tara:strand:+ start:934 stop:2352 length:1419 start_codon:yes stop_codon:yes gene_type:complete
MSNKQSSLPGQILEFELFQAKDGGESIDISEAVVEIRYYEDVLSNSVSLSAIVAETGGSNKKSFGNKGVLDGLPIRGGEPSHIVIEDKDKKKLRFKNDNMLYINRVRNVIPGTSKDVYILDFTSRETLSNEQVRVVKRYNGKISDSVDKILKEATVGSVGLKTQKKVEVDPSVSEFNFIGNDRKPFYVCTWLASKATPEPPRGGKLGGAAGYLFYETYDGYKFKAIDVLFNRDKNKPKGNYIFTNTDDIHRGYKGKILEYNIERDIDLQNNLVLGTYANRTLFFDFMKYEYQIRPFSVDPPVDPPPGKEGEQTSPESSKGKLENLGSEDLPLVADEFRKPISRLMTRVLDIGTMPSGETAEKQLENWKDNKEKPTYDAGNSMVQSVMRYNQMFSIKINITIAGDFTLRAGDLIYCEFPEVSTNPNTKPNKKSGGLYMISSLCHRLTPKDTYTSLTLVRDTFGKTKFIADKES